MSQYSEGAVHTLRWLEQNASGWETRLTPGLTSDELAGIEHEFGITFGRDHRDLLTSVLPVDGGFIDWRSGSRERIRAALRWPWEGVMFDVDHNAFWPEAWGRRPLLRWRRRRIAGEHEASAPRLVPLFDHRFLPGNDAPEGAPVLSVYQTDVVYYGYDLEHWSRLEFFADADRSGEPRWRVPFWTDVVEQEPTTSRRRMWNRRIQGGPMLPEHVGDPMPPETEY